MANKPTILIVDDDNVLRTQLVRGFERRNYNVLSAGSYLEALEVVQDSTPDKAILDLKMPGQSGLDTLKSLRQKFPTLEAVILTGYGSISTAVDAMRLGAVNYLPKPADIDDILAAFEKAENPPLESVQQDYEAPSLARAEWEHINRVLNDVGGNISEAARRLGMHRRSLQRKLQKYPPKT